eukprot:Gb_41649 [translate_table: standard]
MLLLFSLITNSGYSASAASWVPQNENEGVIILQREGNANRLGDSRATLACDQKYHSVSCPVSCFRPDPVCGVDGVTYWCGCVDAQCAGIEVAKVGFCEVGNGGNGVLSRQALLLDDLGFFYGFFESLWRGQFLIHLYNAIPRLG